MKIGTGLGNIKIKDFARSDLYQLKKPEIDFHVLIIIEKLSKNYKI